MRQYCLPTRWLTLLAMCWQRISASPVRLWKTYRGKSCLFFRLIPLARLRSTNAQRQGRWASRNMILRFAPISRPLPSAPRVGEVRIADSTTCKVSTTVAAAIVTVHPGGLREVHWHANADEWQ